MDVLGEVKKEGIESVIISYFSGPCKDDSKVRAE